MNAVFAGIGAMPTRARILRATLRAYSPTVAAVCIAIALRCVMHLCADVSWLITLGERMLTGARPYIDFIETNPPASILLYFPAVWMGNKTGLAPEALVILFVFITSFASLAISARILVRAHLVDPAELSPFATLALIILLIIPFYTFAQREHIALLAMLPILCVYMARATGDKIRIGIAIVAGLGGGLAVIIKLYFALALLLPSLYLVWRRRHEKWRATLSILAFENIVAGLLSVAYLLVVVRDFPAFIHSVLPLVSTLYVPARRPFISMITGASTLLVLLISILATRLAGRDIEKPLYAVPLLSALGFIVVAILEGKGWPYHGYPAVALSLLAAGVLLLRRAKVAPRRGWFHVTTIVYVMYLCIAGYWFSRNAEVPGLSEAVTAIAPLHPKILAISNENSLGHPLTRLVGGKWVGTTCSLWMTDYAAYLLKTQHLDAAQTAKVRAYAALDRSLLIHDIQKGRPDVILVDGPSQKTWAMSYPAIRAALNAYRPVRAVGRVEIWLRKPAA